MGRLDKFINKPDNQNASFIEQSGILSEHLQQTDREFDQIRGNPVQLNIGDVRGSRVIYSLCAYLFERVVSQIERAQIDLIAVALRLANVR